MISERAANHLRCSSHPHTDIWTSTLWPVCSSSFISPVIKHAKHVTLVTAAASISSFYTQFQLKPRSSTEKSFIRVKTEPCVHSQTGLIWTIKLSSEHISYIVCCAGVECRPVYCLSSLRLLREGAENISHVVCFDRNSAI